MRFEFKNIGPVEAATLELNKLTIIAGGNNTGKTYLTYSLYGFLKMWKRLTREEIKELKTDYEIFKKELGCEIKITPAFTDKILKHISAIYTKQLHTVFNSSDDNFKHSQFYTSIKGRFETKNNKNIRVEFGEQGFVEGWQKDDNIVIKAIRDASGNIPDDFILADIFNSIVTSLLFDNYLPECFILSAERLGVSLFYKELDITKNVLVEQLQKLSDKGKTANPMMVFDMLKELSARYALPIKDNINFTRDIDRIQKLKSEFYSNCKLADKIKDIMGGTFKKVNKEIRFISNARKKGSFDIPLYLASSSARGLSDMYFYLKHIAKPGQLLIIDEPESHLNPANQIQLARLIALCVNNGLNIFMTTHSDYIIKELNNLIMLNNEFKDKEQFLKKNDFDYTPDDYLKPEDVFAYIADKGTLTKCTVDNRGMEILSFDETITKINQASNKLEFMLDDEV